MFPLIVPPAPGEVMDNLRGRVRSRRRDVWSRSPDAFAALLPSVFTTWAHGLRRLRLAHFVARLLNGAALSSIPELRQVVIKGTRDTPW